MEEAEVVHVALLLEGRVELLEVLYLLDLKVKLEKQ